MTTTILDIPAERIDGTTTTLKEYAGKVLLIVNVASQCGLTPQYEGLEKLYEAQRDRGLVVLGFPTNDFGAQEPGTNSEIAEFCSTKFNVQFPMFEKISVKESDRHPLYQQLIAAQPAMTEKPGSGFRERLKNFGHTQEKPTDVFWNFEKFLVARDGTVVGRFAPDITPDDPILMAAIEKELAKP